MSIVTTVGGKRGFAQGSTRFSSGVWHRLFWLIVFLLLLGFSIPARAGDPTNERVTFISSVSFTFEFDLAAPGSDTPFMALSADDDFATVLSSGVGTLGQQATTYLNLASNTTYYFKVKDKDDNDDSTYTGPAVSTVTHIEAIASVYLDDISSTSIVASAYAISPGFTNLNDNFAGIAISCNTEWADWRVWGDSWTTKAEIPIARQGLTTTLLGGKIYAIGGGGGASMQNEEYDPVSDTWATRADTLTGMIFHGAAAVGRKIYVFGGAYGNTINEEYDPETDSWITRAPMPTGREKLCAAAVNGKIYVLGGQGATTANEEYDPATNAWAAKKAIPTGRYYMAAAVREDKIYVLGGFGLTAKNEEYDPSNNTWTTREPMPTARYALAAANLGGKVYAIGGYDTGALDTNEEYDPTTNEWVTSSVMPTQRYRLAAVAVAGNIYAMGTTVGDGQKNEAYDPGVSIRFDNLLPNAQYTFTAKARNTDGVETSESAATSSYTAAGLPVLVSTGSFQDVFATSMTISWVQDENPANTEYRMELSTTPNFDGSGDDESAWTTNVSFDYEDLSTNTTFYAQVKARNFDNVETGYVLLGSTTTLAAPPQGAFSFSNVFKTSVTISWSVPADGTSGFLITASSTNFNGTDTAYSSATLDGSQASLTFEDLDANTSYYFRGRSYNWRLDLSSYSVMGTTVTHIEDPVSIFIDELFQTTVTISAYAPFFTNLGVEVSGVNFSSDNAATWQGWTASADAWASRNNTNFTPRFGLASAVFGGKIYVIGGDDAGMGKLDTNEEYDPVSNSWASRASMPTARRFLTCAAVGGKIYAVGGSDTSVLDLNEEYDPATNIWITRAPMLTARRSLTSSVVGNKIYAIGGSGGDTVNEEYDPATNSWTTKASMSTGREDLVSSVVGDKIYAIGGINGNTANEEYDPGSDSWSTRASMPTGRYALASSAVGGKIYAIGGDISVNTAVNEEYDPATNTWTTKSAMITARRYLTSQAVSGRIYAIGGWDTDYSDVVEEYNPGVSYKFTSPDFDEPNMEFDFAVKARNLHGVETQVISTTVYTAAYAPAAAVSTFTAVSSVAVAVAWDDNGNSNASDDVYYLLDVSTASVFNATGDFSLGWMTSVSSYVGSLTPNTTYYFKVKARNEDSVETAYHNLGSTLTLTVDPENLTILEVFESSVTAGWYALGADPDNYSLEASSTNFDGTDTTISSVTANVSVTTLTVTSLIPNTTYYLRAGALWNDTTGYSDIASSSTYIEAPISIYIDELYPSTVTISAYAPSFTNLKSTGSGINFSSGTAFGWAGWTVTADSWTARDDMSKGRLGLTAAVAGGKIYAIGGLNGTVLGTNEEYDPAANSWALRAPMPTERAYLTAATVADKIYAIGGNNGGKNQNEEYDPVANSWITRALMPTGRHVLTAAAAKNKIYVIGGSSGQDKNEEYDPATNSWTSRALMPTQRQYPAAASVGGKIYVVGGDNGDENQNEEYDPEDGADGSWTTRASMPIGLMGSAAVAAGGKIYAIGGANGGVRADNYEYDPGSDLWTTRDSMLTARWILAAVFTGGKIYAIGGNAGTKEQNEMYDPGVSFKFTGSDFDPNEEFTFYVKARNQHGIETQTISTTVYTAAYAPSIPLTVSTFTAVSSVAVTVSWDDNGNDDAPDEDVQYFLEGSTASVFNGTNDFSIGWFTDVSSYVASLTPHTTYFFKVKARNFDGVETAYHNLGSTLTHAVNPENLTILEVFESSVTAGWYALGIAPDNYSLEASSTNFDGTDTIISSVTTNVSVTTLTVTSLIPNTTYYLRAGALWNGTTGYSDIASSSTYIEAPTMIFIDELYPSSVTVSAYAPSFTNLKSTGSGINFSSGTAFGWAGWSVTADSWTVKAELPTGGGGSAIAYAGGKIYVIGADGPEQTNDEYDPVANNWAVREVVPTGRGYASAHNVNGKIYVIGGDTGNPTGVNEEYDPAANTWVTKAPMLEARAGFASAVVGNKIYVFGGENTTYLKTSEEYDVSADMWTAKVNMPTEMRAYFAAAAVGDKIYVIGGENAANLTLNEEYDPTTDTWDTRAPMPTARQMLGVSAVGGKIYAVGGDDSANSDVNEEYDPATNTWATKTSLSADYSDSAAVSAEGKIYLAGGTHLEIYDPGVSFKFTGSDFDPNEEFTFYVKARNQHGIETQTISTTVYTAAYAPSIPLTVSTFTAVSSVAVTVSWDDNGNDDAPDEDVQYFLEGSTASVFNGTNDFSIGWFTDVSSYVASLTPHTTYFFKVKARNFDGVETAYHNLGSTLTHAVNPENLTILEVFESSVTAGWYALGIAPDNYSLEASSTNFDGTDTIISSVTTNVSVTTLTVTSLIPNTTYYLRAGALWNGTTGYSDIASSSTYIEAPTMI
ncbi:fibronectin type III domain-containing protein, partial [Elusimicrobiota bacterium]